MSPSWATPWRAVTSLSHQGPFQLRGLWVNTADINRTWFVMRCRGFRVFLSILNKQQGCYEPPEGEVKISFPWDFPQLCGEDEGLPTCSGNGLHVLTFPPELCLLSEHSGRAYRYCLSQGTWQTLENSTDIWQDNSECAEDHSFKQKVSQLGSVRTGPGAQTNLCWGPRNRGHTKSLPPVHLPQTHLGRSSVTQNSNPDSSHRISCAAGMRCEPPREGAPASVLAVPSAWNTFPSSSVASPSH